MTISDWINVALCLLSFILAVISVVTVVITLRQNHRMIQNSTRPYVVATCKVTNFQNPSFYLIIKNYGNSGATIKQIKFSIDINKYSFHKECHPFSKIKDTFIAPSQTIISNLDNLKMSDDGVESFNVDITYTDELKTYNEQYVINFKAYTQNVITRAATKGAELKTISYTLQDLVEKQF